jgi:hypothetical protein
MTSHRLVVDQALIEQDYKTAETDIKYSLFYQMTRITKDRGALVHDDRLDAVEGAVRYWTKAMARDNEKANAQHRSTLLARDLKNFMQHVFPVLGRPQAPNWKNGSAASRR